MSGRVAAAVLAVGVGACSNPSPLRMATTTSVEASGLLRRMLPDLESSRGVRIEAVAVGSGKALRILERGDAHLALTHDPDGEQALVSRGLVERHEIMWNHFVLVGPPDDPAKVRAAKSAPEALRRIASARAPFASRGDDSGTHRAEKRLWSAAGVEPSGSWYRETGQGQGMTLQVTHEIRGYMLTDLSTFTAYRGRLDLAVVLRGDPQLRNVYSVLVPKRLDEGARKAARVLLEWLRTEPARAHMRALGFEPVS